MATLGTPLLSEAAVSCGLLLLCGAALHDLAARTVPNRLAAAIAACGLAAQALGGGLAWSLLAALAVFVAAALLWRRGWMGGGDVKLLAAAALLVPADTVPAMLAAVALAGGALAIPYLLARRRLKRVPAGRPHRLAARAWRAERWRLRRGGPLPYAVAIACGALFVIAPAPTLLAHDPPTLLSGALP